MSLSSNFIKSLSAEYKALFVYYFIDEYLKNCEFYIETKCSASGTYPKLYDAEIIFIFTMYSELFLDKAYNFALKEDILCRSNKYV